ncbi:hypothetical protein [Clostridium arbusti]|uniref:hypothetical protein n=1 Tax=Clostridium arbusti TaxID=1137848 RepID=UPI0002884D98|nr:hypothetical protein [Clostridium arbusti]
MDLHLRLLARMLEKNLIREIDTELIADEYNYALVAMTFEYAHATNDGKDTAPIIRKMFKHIKFICDYLKPNEIK